MTQVDENGRRVLPKEVARKRKRERTEREREVDRLLAAAAEDPEEEQNLRVFAERSRRAVAAAAEKVIESAERRRRKADRKRKVKVTVKALARPEGPYTLSTEGAVGGGGGGAFLREDPNYGFMCSLTRRTLLTLWPSLPEDRLREAAEEVLSAAFVAAAEAVGKTATLYRLPSGPRGGGKRLCFLTETDAAAVAERTGEAPEKVLRYRVLRYTLGDKGYKVRSTYTTSLRRVSYSAASPGDVILDAAEVRVDGGKAYAKRAIRKEARRWRGGRRRKYTALFPFDALERAFGEGDLAEAFGERVDGEDRPLFPVPGRGEALDPAEVAAVGKVFATLPAAEKKAFAAAFEEAEDLKSAAVAGGRNALARARRKVALALAAVGNAEAKRYTEDRREREATARRRSRAAVVVVTEDPAEALAEDPAEALARAERAAAAVSGKTAPRVYRRALAAAR